MTDGPAMRDPLVQRVIRDDVRAMARYHVPASEGLVKLDAMENPHGLPADLAQALGNVLGRLALNRYPVPDYAALKAAIRSKMGVPEGFDVLLGNGSDELISMVLQATARPGAVVLSPWPSFVMYELSARFAHSRFEPVPLAADFALDLPAMLAAIRTHQPAVVFLAYPNNPTGNCFDDAQIAAILQAAPGLVVIDEAYQPFAGATWMDRLPAHPNLVVLRTVSKLGLAGIRLGYLSASAALLAEFDKVRPPYNVNVLTEATALFVLDHVGVLQAQAAQLRAERSHLLSALRGLEGVTPFESRANFVLMRVEQAGQAKGATGPSVWRGLLEKKVLVKDVGKMHPLLADCLRVTVGTPEENAVFLRALKATLDAPIA